MKKRGWMVPPGKDRIETDFHTEFSDTTRKIRLIRALKESIHVYADGQGTLRTDHTSRFFRIEILRLHYKISPKSLWSGDLVTSHSAFSSGGSVAAKSSAKRWP
jgi:hypothetical protein